MKIYGEFVNKKGKAVSVAVEAAGTGKDIEITDGGDIQFAEDDTVTTSCGLNDLLDVVQSHSCTLRLETRRFVRELFAKGVHSASVSVKEDGKSVFEGWLEPGTYSQDFVELYDDLEVNCVDWLASLQYTNFRKVGSGVAYPTAKAGATTHTFLSLITEALNYASGGKNWQLWYDGSKSLPGGKGSAHVLEELSVNDLAFLGDTEDDVMTYQDVVESVLKYLDLHVVQYGTDIYLYSWETLRKGAVTWTLLHGTGSAAEGGSVTLTEKTVSDTGQQVDVGETFNLLSLKVSPTFIDTLVDSPLGDDSTPAFSARQKYVTEYVANGKGHDAAMGFKDFVSTGTSTCKDGSVTDYYVRVKRATGWTFGSAGVDWKEKFCADGSHQEKMLNQLAGSIGAQLVSVGKVTLKSDNKDNTPSASSITMDDYLVISVNGNEKDDDGMAEPSTDTVRAAMPVAVYDGGTNGGVYSPADDGMKNYLVISGSVILNPVLHTAGYGLGVMGPWVYDEPIGRVRAKKDSITANGAVPGRDGDRYVIFDWWKAAQAKDAVTEDLDPQGSGSYSVGWKPWTDDGPQQYEFEYSTVGDGTDKVSKVGVIDCMLTIGEGADKKVLVENKTGDGRPADFSWQAYKEKGSCTEDEYYAQTFSIGFDPKIGDKIIGAEYQIGRNFDFNMNISEENGMAIPLPYGAHLHGHVHLEILGPVLWTWNDITRRHPTMFRHTKWTEKDIPLMAHVSSILLKNLKMTICSDSDQSDNGDSDIIYMSRTDESFYNKKDDLEMKVHSGFTSSECQKHHLKTSACVASVTKTQGGDMVLSIHDENSGEDGKAEKLYVNAYYQALHVPRVALTANVEEAYAKPFGDYTHPALGPLYVESMGANLKDGTCTMRLMEK